MREEGDRPQKHPGHFPHDGPDIVDVASEHSFPASDAPGWAIGRGFGPTPAAPATTGADRVGHGQRDDPAPPLDTR